MILKGDSIGMIWSGYDDSMPNYIDETLSKVKAMPNADLKQEFE